MGRLIPSLASWLCRVQTVILFIMFYFSVAADEQPKSDTGSEGGGKKIYHLEHPNDPPGRGLKRVRVRVETGSSHLMMKVLPPLLQSSRGTLII